MSTPQDNAATQSFRTWLVRTLARTTVRPLFSGWLPVAAMRQGLWLASRSSPVAAGSSFTATMLNGVRAEKVTCGEPGERVVLYFHGGAYCVGSPATHRAITSRIARNAAATVYTVDYRLAPETPFPAAVDDALDSYQALLEQGIDPAQISIAGDSAGAGLTLACMLAAWEAHLPMPDSLVLMSPWVDLNLANRNQSARGDVMLSWAGLDKAAEMYAGSERDHVLASPLKADFHGLPPVLIQAGSDEILLMESQQLCERLRACGVNARLNVFDGMWHVFQAHGGLLAVADTALDDIGSFIRQRVHP